MMRSNISEWAPRPGCLIKANHPDPRLLPLPERNRLGVVVGILPPKTGHPYVVCQWLVLWSDNVDLTIEPDHRIRPA